MKKTYSLFCFFCIFCLFLLPAIGEDQPEWEYPLPPEILANAEGFLTLTNKSSLLDEDYVPEDLVNLTVKRVVQGELRKPAHDALAAMFAAAEQSGYTLYAKSVYRSYQTQKTMYYNRLDKVGRDDGVVAYPGSSDHQTGLGVDVLNYAWTKKDGMNAEFGKTQEAKWMAAHCQEYGFIIRYMEDKEDVTGIIYEPWHLRYVGPEAAAYIMENHLSLEEFTETCQSWLNGYAEAGGDFEALLRERAKLNDVSILDTDPDGEEELSIYY